MKEYMKGWMDGRIGEKMDELIWMDGGKNRRMIKWVDGGIGERTNEWMVERIDR